MAEGISLDSLLHGLMHYRVQKRGQPFERLSTSPLQGEFRRES